MNANTKTIKINKDEITIEKVEIPFDKNTSITEIFVEFWQNGVDNIWSEIFKSEDDANAFIVEFLICGNNDKAYRKVMEK